MILIPIPFVGFDADKTVVKMLNDEYKNSTWYMNNDAGVPMLAVSLTKMLPHGLHPAYGTIAWDFMKHYSRDAETGKLVYTP